MTWRALLVTLVMASLITLGGAAAATPPDEFLITPGGGIGPVKLGMPLSGAIARLGSPSSVQTIGTHDIETYTNYIWEEMGHRFIVQTRASKPNEVFSVWILFDRRYESASGLHVGMAPSTVEYMMGPATQAFRLAGMTMLVYRPQGIAFLVGDDSRARQWWNVVYGIIVSHEFKVVF